MGAKRPLSRLSKRVCAIPAVGRFRADPGYRNYVTLHASLTLNLLYAAANGCSAVLYRSAWFAVYAGYYAILAVMRFLLLRHTRKYRLGDDRLRELRRARLCALLLTTLNLVLPAAVLMILYRGRGFDYPGVMIYAMALYTFWVTGSALRDVIRFRAYDDPILSVSKAIKMAAALVSMLALETAMFAQFGGEMALEDQRLMIALTGAGVSVVVITMAISLTVRSTREIKEIRRLH